MGLINSGVGVDENLAQRVRLVLESFDATERRMFGGICFMIGGHMCCGVDESDLIVRLDKPAAQRALRRQHATVFMTGGRTVSSFVRVAGAGVANKRNLVSWLSPAAKLASARPAKQEAGKSPKENFNDNVR